MYANLAVQELKFDSVAAALQNMQMRQAENKLHVQEWLDELGILSKNLRIASFVHVPQDILQGVWPHLVTRFKGTNLAGRAFVDRLSAGQPPKTKTHSLCEARTHTHAHTHTRNFHGIIASASNTCGRDTVCGCRDAHKMRRIRLQHAARNNNAKTATPDKRPHERQEAQQVFCY